MQSLRRNYDSAELQTFFKGLDSETIRRIAEYSPAEFVAEVTRLKREQEIQVSAFERFMGIGRGGRRGGRGGPGFGRGNEPPPRGGRGQRSDGRGGDGNRDEDRRNRDDNDNNRRRGNDGSKSNNERKSI